MPSKQVDPEASLAGQVAAISGGLGDIGSAIARELARRGATIAVSDLANSSDDRVAMLRDDITLLEAGFRYDKLDVTDRAATEAWLHKVVASLGSLRIVVANAAVVKWADHTTQTEADWESTLGVNLTGAMHTAEAGVGIMLNQPERDPRSGGLIVFVGSWAGDRPHRHIPAYCVAKAGLRMLVKTLAMTYADRRILVNEVAPGYVDAGLSGKVFQEQPELRAKAERVVPIRELMSPDEVAFHVAHLCDPRNCNMTGTVLTCDGGLSLLGPAAGE